MKHGFLSSMAILALGLPLHAASQDASGGARVDAAAFTTPSALGIGIHAQYSKVAVDAAGNALATWVETGAPPAPSGSYYSRRPAGGAWSTAQPFQGGAAAGLQIRPNGDASLLSWSYNSVSIWIDDLPAGGAWQPPQFVSSAASPTFGPHLLKNSRGDAAVVYQTGSTLMAMLRPAGAPAWGAPVVAYDLIVTATANQLRLEDAALGDAGDLLVAFDTMYHECHLSRYWTCTTTNYQVHATRGTIAGTAWSDSGTLATNPVSPTYAHTVVDPKGHALLFYVGDYQSTQPYTLLATAQPRAGAAWGAAATVVAGSLATGQCPFMQGASTDAKGHVSVVYTISTLVASSDIMAVDGSDRSNTWGTPLNLSAGANGPGGTVIYGANANGGSIIEWTDVDAGIHVNKRRRFGLPWSPRQDVVPAVLFCGAMAPMCSTMGGAAIDAAGKAVLSYTIVTSAPTIETETTQVYATTN